MEHLIQNKNPQTTWKSNSPELKNNEFFGNKTISPIPETSFKPPEKRIFIRDFSSRIAYSKRELSQVLPFGHTSIEEMISKGLFPDGIRPHPTGHKFWPKKDIDAWIEEKRRQQ